MRTIGFIGPSGTGKSHRATWVSRERGIECIIDDGLLIRGNNIIAGHSAKRESTRIGSIKCALFTDEVHAAEVKKAFNMYKPESVLILGTSDEMVDTIAKRLEIGPVVDKIYIHEVASEFEIKQALSTRRGQGKHVIPVPTFELKKEFSGYFLDPLQVFRRRGKGSYQLVGEKSVVRPTFSYMGRYTISDYTIYQIAEHVATSIDGVHKISRFRAENHPDGLYMEMDLVLVYGYVLRPLLAEVQIKIKNEIEYLTSINIKRLNLTAKSIIVDKNK